MSTKVDELTEKLAARLKRERESRGWSLADLAEKSGVSRAMISKIERRETSPTAVLLGRLSGAFGLSLSALLVDTEGEKARLRRRADQPIWRDPTTGFQRRALSPNPDAILQLTLGELPPAQRISYPASAFVFLHQQIWVLSGILHFREGKTLHRLGAGDCLELGPPVDCRFENLASKPCRYLVATSRRA